MKVLFKDLCTLYPIFKSERSEEERLEGCDLQ